MDNYLDEAGEADHGGHLLPGSAPDDKRLRGPAARVQPVFSALPPAPRLSVAASAWRATVVFTNLPKIAARRGPVAAAGAAEEHLFPTAGANVIRALGGTRPSLGSRLTRPQLWGGPERSLLPQMEA